MDFNPFKKTGDATASGGARWRNPGLWVVAVFVLFVGLFAYTVNDLMKALLHSRVEVIVPNVEGQTLIDAIDTVSAAGLALQQDNVEFDEGLPAGTVVRQHPPSGMKVRSGRAVRVVISKGGQVMFVPDVYRRPLQEAQSLLALDGLQIGAIEEFYDADAAEGFVIAQEPSSGTVVTRGALVDLRISKGAPPADAVSAPDFGGRGVDEVHAWAASHRISVTVTEDERAVGAAGTVVAQFPVPGQPVLPRQAFQVTVVPLVAAAGGSRFSYRLPQRPGDLHLRIVARDNRGEFEAYRGVHRGGELVEVPLAVTSATRIRVYVDDVLDAEEVLEP